MFLFPSLYVRFLTSVCFVYWFVVVESYEDSGYFYMLVYAPFMRQIYVFQGRGIYISFILTLIPNPIIINNICVLLLVHV